MWSWAMRLVMPVVEAGVAVTAEQIALYSSVFECRNRGGECSRLVFCRGRHGAFSIACYLGSSLIEEKQP